MESNSNVPVLEPRSSMLSFISTSSLIDHVVKHVIEASEERWISVFYPELIIRVRDAYWDNDSIYNTEDFRLLTTLYARQAAKTIAQCCSRGVGHVHQLDDVYTIESHIVKCVSRYQKIQAYSEEDKTVVIAALKIDQEASQSNNSQQKEGKQDPQDYVILTMYRPEKKLLKKQSFKSWFNDRIERGNPMHPYETLLADHR